MSLRAAIVLGLCACGELADPPPLNPLPGLAALALIADDAVHLLQPGATQPEPWLPVSTADFAQLRGGVLWRDPLGVVRLRRGGEPDRELSRPCLGFSVEPGGLRFACTHGEGVDVYRHDGALERRVSTSFVPLWPLWAPDGRLFVAVPEPDGVGWLGEVLEGEVIERALGSDGYTLAPLAVQDDGAVIVWEQTLATGSRDLLRLAGGALSPLPSPAWWRPFAVDKRGRYLAELHNPADGPRWLTPPGERPTAVYEVWLSELGGAPLAAWR